MNFLNPVIVKLRESLVREFFQSFLKIKDEKEGIIKPVFTSAFELGEDEKMKYKNYIDILTKKNSQPTFEVNPGLIGGFTINVGDSMIDGSVK